MNEKPFFIHIPKAAGTAIKKGFEGKISAAWEHYLKSWSYVRAVKRHMDKRSEHDGIGHARWRDVCEDAHRRRCFAVIRNPWSRVVSRYFYSQMVAENGRPPNEPYVIYPKQSFESFLEERHEWGHEPYYWHRAVRGWYPSFDHVCDEQGICRCEMMRFEYLREDLFKFMGEWLPTRKRNVTPNSRPYTEMYTPRTIQIVADWYAKDIEYWDFDYMTSARKNTIGTP